MRIKELWILQKLNITIRYEHGEKDSQASYKIKPNLIFNNSSSISIHISHWKHMGGSENKKSVIEPNDPLLLVIKQAQNLLVLTNRVNIQ